MKILLVEDDDRIADPLAEALGDRHYVVEIAPDGSEGLNLAQSLPYDLIILDLMLPKIDGITLCRQLRNAGIPTPVLMLTARDTSSDKVMGLDVGADDYVVKPFDLPELLARVRALLRRGNQTLPPVLEWECLQLNPNTCQVEYKEKLLHLTPKEYSLLELFLRSGDRVLSRSIILDNLWSFEEPPGKKRSKFTCKACGKN